MKLKFFLTIVGSLMTKNGRNKLVNKLNDEHDLSLTYADIEYVRDTVEDLSKSSATVVLLGFLSYLSVRNLNYRKKKSIAMISLLFGLVEVISNIISDTCDKIVDDSEYDYGCDIEMFMHDDEEDDSDEMIPDSNDIDAEIAEDIDTYDRNDLEDGETAVGTDSYI